MSAQQRPGFPAPFLEPRICLGLTQVHLAGARGGLRLVARLSTRLGGSYHFVSWQVLGPSLGTRPSTNTADRLHTAPIFRAASARSILHPHSLRCASVPVISPFQQFISPDPSVRLLGRPGPSRFSPRNMAPEFYTVSNDVRVRRECDNQLEIENCTEK